MKIGIIGVTGLIGSELARVAHAAGHEVVGFSRQAESKVDGVSEMRGIDGFVADFSGLEVLVNLAGFPVNCRWTEEKRRLIRSSRIDLTRAVVRQLAAIDPPQRPKRLVCGTAIGIYGERGDEEIDEHSEVGIDGFLGEVVRDWELAAAEVESLGIPATCVRTGIVLGRDGQAFDQMRRVFALGLGGKLGKGQQWMSWIHLQDLARLFLWVADQKMPPPIVNGTAPEPERNGAFTRKLAVALKRPALLPVPGFALRMVLGPFGEWLLKSTKVLPKVALEAGFEFDYPDLESALADLVRE